MDINSYIFFVAALIPLATGFIWYHPKVFGNAWMKSAGLSEERVKGANMALIFGLTYIFSLLIAFVLSGITIHQFGLLSLMADQPDVYNPDSPAGQELKELMDRYGDRYRTFGHGAFHGAIAGIFLAFPVIAVNALFERKNFRYSLINSGFWIVTIALMGGLVCAFA
jgi:hypothetical protein